MIDDLTLRGTWAEGFRAPSIGELFSSSRVSMRTIMDPCNGATGQAGENCAALGVPIRGSSSAIHRFRSVTGGNAALQPETSSGLTLGAVYSPSWAANTAWSQKRRF